MSDNRAMVLDGVGAGVLTNLTNQQTFDSAATIVAWVYLAQQRSTAGHCFYIAGRSQIGNDLDLLINSDNILRFYADAGGGVTAPAALPTDHRDMVAGSLDTGAGTRKLYIDGIAVADNTPGVHSTNSSPFTISFRMSVNAERIGYG